MKTLKNFFGFGRDGLMQEGILQTEQQLNFTNEDCLGREDLLHIFKHKSKGLYLLGKKLDRLHNQYFNTELYSKGRAKVHYNYNGKYYTMLELSEMSGIKKGTIYGRLHRGDSIERALTTNKLRLYRRNK